MPAGRELTVPRTALITGAARRIGAAMARHLAAKGWAVAIHYRDSRREAERAVRRIADAGGRALSLPADLAHVTQVDDLVSKARRELGPVGLLINNAAEFAPDTLETAAGEPWERHLDVNARAPLVLMGAFARQLPEDAGGGVVNVLDGWVLAPPASFVSYAVSKAALATLTVSMAKALAPRIRVNALAPGPTLRHPRQSEANFARLVKEGTLLQRATSPEELCLAVDYLVATETVTGQVIKLDGGQHLL